MTDIASIGAGVQALRAATDIVKAVVASSAALKTAELKLKIGELTDYLVTARTALVEAQEEIHSLKERLHSLQAAKDISAELKFENKVYYRGNDAFCPTCWDARKQLIRVTELESVFRDMGRFLCNECRGVF